MGQAAAAVEAKAEAEVDLGDGLGQVAVEARGVEVDLGGNF
jgi:hypothetical protein